MPNRGHRLSLTRRSFRVVAAFAFVIVILAGVAAASPTKNLQPSPSPATSSSMSEPDSIAHVYVAANGDVYLDKRETTIDQLNAALGALADKHGVVWYSRQNGDTDPNPSQEKAIEAVLDAIVAHRLPVRMLPNDPDGQPPTPTP